MSPIIVFVAVWLLVIGYGLVYIGYNNYLGHGVSFQQAFFGRVPGTSAPSKSSTAGNLTAAGAAR